MSPMPNHRRALEDGSDRPTPGPFEDDAADEIEAGLMREDHRAGPSVTENLWPGLMIRLRQRSSNKGYKVVSAMPSLKDGHPTADITLMKSAESKTVSRPLD